MSIKKRTIDQETAEKLMKTAIAKAVDMKIPMAIAITDEVGTVKNFTRMDGTPILSVQVAQDKAYTAAAFGQPTHVWWDMIKDDPPLANGFVHTPRVIIYGGGYPIEEKGQVIGAIGVSGGHYTHDMQVAEAALSAIASD